MNGKINICIEQIKCTTRHIQDDYIIYKIGAISLIRQIHFHFVYVRVKELTKRYDFNIVLNFEMDKIWG